MSEECPPTVIVRHSHENPRKCSVLPLRGRPDLLFLNYPVKSRPPLDGYVRLSAEGPLLSAEALFVAYHVLGRPTAGLLDHYRWAADFLQLNQEELATDAHR